VLLSSLPSFLTGEGKSPSTSAEGEE
jgi:hypothetical protein